MPSVERVLSDQQTADAAETTARQMGALLQLKKMIEDAAGPRFFDRRVGLTPDETRICQDYYTAYYRISQSKENTRSSPRCVATISTLAFAISCSSDASSEELANLVA
jgi:hypothetical protein